MSGQERFLATDLLIGSLAARTDEPWAHFTRNQWISREALAKLLRPFGIKSAFNKQHTHKGYYAHNFAEAWNRYPAPRNAQLPSLPTLPSLEAEFSRANKFPLYLWGLIWPHQKRNP